MANQTPLQAWQSALYALIDGAAVHLTPQEYAALRITVELRMARRANEHLEAADNLERLPVTPA